MQEALGEQLRGSMVKMSVDPVQVMSGQVQDLKVSPSSNGDSRGPWEEKEEFNQDRLGLTTKPKSVGVTHSLFASFWREGLARQATHPSSSLLISAAPASHSVS